MSHTQQYLGLWRDLLGCCIEVCFLVDRRNAVLVIVHCSQHHAVRFPIRLICSAVQIPVEGKFFASKELLIRDRFGAVGDLRSKMRQFMM